MSYTSGRRTAKDDRNSNMMKMLHKIINTPYVSRSELISFMNIGNTSAINILNELISKGIVNYTSPNNNFSIKPRGRHGSYLVIDESSCFTSCITVDKAKITISLMTLSLNMLEKREWNFNYKNPDDALNFVKNCFDKVLRNNLLIKDKIIGTTFVLSPFFWDEFDICLEEGVVYAPNLQIKLEKTLGLPVYLQTFSASGGYMAFEEKWNDETDPRILYTDFSDCLNCSLVYYSLKRKRVIEYNVMLSKLVFEINNGKSLMTYSDAFTPSQFIHDTMQKMDEKSKNACKAYFENNPSADKLSYAISEIENDNTFFVNELLIRLKAFAISFYNIAASANIDHIFIAGICSRKLHDLIKFAIKEALGEEISEKFYFLGQNMEFVYKGACTNTISAGFPEYYKKLEYNLNSNE